MTPEAQRYAEETEREAAEHFRVRSLAMLKASLEHPDALECLTLPGMEPARPAEQLPLFGASKLVESDGIPGMPGWRFYDVETEG